MHKMTDETVIAPTVVTAIEEDGYLFGVRLPAAMVQCRNGEDELWRIDPRPVYFLLNVRDLQQRRFDHGRDGPFETRDRDAFEAALAENGLERGEELDHASVSQWSARLEERYMRPLYRNCFGGDAGDGVGPDR